MRTRVIFLLCLGGLLLPTTSCRKAEKVGEPATKDEAATSKETPVDAFDKNWWVRLEGVNVPESAGTIVEQKELSGSFIHYTLLNDDQKTDLELKDVKPGQTGTFTAYSLQIAYFAQDLACGASEMDQRTNATVTIKQTNNGIHATIDGTVSCSALDGEVAAGVRPLVKPATVHAWFEK